MDFKLQMKLMTKGRRQSTGNQCKFRDQSCFSYLQEPHIAIMNGRMQYWLLQRQAPRGYGHTPGDNKQEEGYPNESSQTLLDNDSKNPFRSHEIHVLCVRCARVWNIMLVIMSNMPTWISRNNCIQILSVSDTLLSEISELAPARLWALCRIFWSEDSVFLAWSWPKLIRSITKNEKGPEI